MNKYLITGSVLLSGALLPTGNISNQHCENDIVMVVDATSGASIYDPKVDGPSSYIENWKDDSVILKYDIPEDTKKIEFSWSNKVDYTEEMDSLSGWKQVGIKMKDLPKQAGQYKVMFKDEKSEISSIQFEVVKSKSIELESGKELNLEVSPEMVQMSGLPDGAVLEYTADEGEGAHLYVKGKIEKAGKYQLIYTEKVVGSTDISKITVQDIVQN